MLQEINLYQIKKVKKNNFLSLKHMLQISFGFLALLAMISIIILYKQYNMNMHLHNLEKTQNSLNKNLDTEKGKIPTEQELEHLTQEVKRLKDLRVVRETMYATLSGIQYKVQPGFTGYLSALTKYTIDGIWFTKLHFGKGGDVIILEGETIAAGNLPKLLQNLGKAPFFSGKKFDAMDVYASDKEKNLLYFTVKTNL